MFMKLTKRRRENLSRFMFSLAQILFGIILVGRFITPERISLTTFVIGSIVFLIFVFWGYVIDKGGE